jgi:hypothetical protein
MYVFLIFSACFIAMPKYKKKSHYYILFDAKGSQTVDISSNCNLGTTSLIDKFID